MKKMAWMFLFLALTTVAEAAVSVSEIAVRQRYPWNGLVDIDYEITSDNPTAQVYVLLEGRDEEANRPVAMVTLSGDGATAPVGPGRHRIVWNAKADDPTLHIEAFKVRIEPFCGIPPYLVIDLTGGPDATSYPVRFSAKAPDVKDEKFERDELWLRMIFPGTFRMGSPVDEIGRKSTELAHMVRLTQPYYIGIYEVSFDQWMKVMGTNPVPWQPENHKPVNNVSYEMIRGASLGLGWPAHSGVEADSFMGRLRARTGLDFDLPTEAQWEYACRAGTDTALNSGRNLTSEVQCPNLAEVGRYCYNRDDANGLHRAYSGSYRPNAWGLYDMHGNVWEWCLDRYATPSSHPDLTVDPPGDGTSTQRVCKGGCDTAVARSCRSASRWSNSTDYRNYEGGFRVVVRFPAGK